MENNSLDKQRRRFDHLIQGSKNILVIGHVNPDEDAVASCLAVDYYLRKKFSQKKITTLLYPPLPVWLSEFLDGQTFLIKRPKKLKDKPDLIVFLDGDTADRFFPGNSFDLDGVKTIRIDHHLTGNSKFSLSIVDKKAAATAQIVAELFFSREKRLKKKIAQLLLMGILGDTGSLRYINPANSNFLRTVEWLVRKGKVDIEHLLNKLEVVEKKEFALIELLLKNTRFVNSRKIPPFSYSFLPKSVLKKGFGEKFIREACHHYLFFFVRKVRGYPWGWVVTPQENGVFNISFRSMAGGPNVAELAEKYFSGGGHARAAGGQIESNKPAHLVCQEVVKIIKKANGGS
jgi:phosphoesterase RecJ-like protein